MKNTIISEKLIDIKRQISALGIEYLESHSPFILSDVDRILKPFTKIDSSIDRALKKLNSNVVSGSIPKSNTLQL